LQPFPHHYRVRASGSAEGNVEISTEGVQALQTAAPPEFGGPEGFWSPESLLVASVADCFLLSFRAVARASRLQWRQLEVDVEGVLDRVEGVTQFASFTLRAQLALEPGVAQTLAQSVLAKAKRHCLITNSLKGGCELVTEIAA
jgi:organic hydroperoxide reductase OsmC/OhrA